MADIIYQPLVGGYTMITGGGTRTAIRLSRPWQQPLPIAPEKCPFCTKPQEELPLPGIPAGWRLLDNPFTPHRRHRLIIPAECWDAETLQAVGGAVKIREALEIARLATVNDPVEIAVFIHIGQSAGQNLGHAHWHLMEMRVQHPFVSPSFSDELHVHEFDKLQIVAMGARAGECLIVDKGSPQKFADVIGELASALLWIVARGNEKFRSTEGNPPEFIASARISSDGYLRYADYCPILNPWGGTEYVFAPLEGGPITLAWPHEVTAEHLRR